MYLTTRTLLILINVPHNSPNLNVINLCIAYIDLFIFCCLGAWELNGKWKKQNDVKDTWVNSSTNYLSLQIQKAPFDSPFSHDLQELCLF